MTTPIRKSVTVPLRPDAAFRLFTEGMGRWWPGETHSVSAARGGRPRAITVTPGAGGPVTEQTPDGRTARWATVKVWEPGTRLTLDWHLGQEEGDDPTSVEITFTPTDDGTRVDLVHDGLVPRGQQAVSAYAGAWGDLLGAFRRAGQGASVTLA
jgi:uncharacterized protein YndB with AHSA1/START domain